VPAGHRRKLREGGARRATFSRRAGAPFGYGASVEHTSFDARGNGLRLRVHRFQDDAVRPSGLTLLLLHGYMDAGGTWDLVAPSLAAQGHSLLAPDFRGFGESDGVGPGGYYHFVDYVADVDALVRELVPAGSRLGLVGHSMGGTIASLYAGSRPERIERLALLEGLGPPAMEPSVTVDRVRAWLRNLEQVQRTPRPLESMDDALRRLAANHPRVPREILGSRARWLTRLDAEGRLTWAYDPLHRTTSPMPFQVEMFEAFLTKITCPALVVGGGPLGYHTDDEQDRIAKLADVEVAELPDAGHMMHWTRPRELGELLARFFGGPAQSSS
jgi:pimeloyl-ACP methyl ester carboxylesterase